MAMIDIDDITIYYDRSGSGPAMLFVHGMCGDAEVWADQARRFSDDFTCVRYDRRGHSRSSRGDAPISAARHADDTAALIAALDLAPCLLVGSSSGAVIALDVARRYGQVLHGVVLTPPTDGRILPGTVRARVLQRLAGDGRRVEERAPTVPELVGSQEVFTTSSIRGVQPVVACTGLGRWPVGPVTTWLRDTRPDLP